MHNNNRLTKQIIILFLIVALAGGCGAPTINPTATSAPPTASPTTHIAIDGNEDDWAGYNVIGSDPAGDQVAGSPDLAEGKSI